MDAEDAGLPPSRRSFGTPLHACSDPDPPLHLLDRSDSVITGNDARRVSELEGEFCCWSKWLARLPFREAGFPRIVDEDEWEDERSGGGG